MAGFLVSQMGRYLSGRGAAAVAEVPLEDAIDSYLVYEKGGLALFSLHHVLGEAAVNRALKNLLHEFRWDPERYASSKDLVRFLRAEASPEQQQLITDLFERIVVWDLSLNNAEIAQKQNGEYEVTLDISAHQFLTNNEGQEVSVQLDQSFEVVLFGEYDETLARRPEIYRQKHHFEKNDRQIKLQLFRVTAGSRD